MSNACPEIWFNTEAGTPDPPPADPTVCGNGTCNCGYIQYESLIPYLDEIKDKLKADTERYHDFEFKLRAQIIAISRLFDVEAGVAPGYFSKAHYTTTKVCATNSTKYLRVPEHVPGTLELRTLSDVVIDPSYYGYENGYLIFLPCTTHTSCTCADGCGGARSARPLPWPRACYKVTAQFGKHCADAAVEMAVREFLIENLRQVDPVQVLANGLPIERRFRVPYAWSTYLNNFKAQRKIHSQWGIA